MKKRTNGFYVLIVVCLLLAATVSSGYGQSNRCYYNGSAWICNDGDTGCDENCPPGDPPGGWIDPGEGGGDNGGGDNGGGDDDPGPCGITKQDLVTPIGQGICLYQTIEYDTCTGERAGAGAATGFLKECPEIVGANHPAYYVPAASFPYG